MEAIKIENLTNRHENPIEKLHQRIKQEADLFGINTCQIFGCNFAEDQHHHGKYDGRKGRRQVGVIQKHIRKQNGRQSGRRNVYDVVAYQNGSDELVIPLVRKIIDGFRVFLALRDKGLQLNSVHAGISGLRCGEKARKHNEYDDYDNQR